MMTYDHELVLIGETFAQDEIGNNIPTSFDTTVLCSVRSVARNEFYNAAAAGIKPEMTFVIHAFEYKGQQKVKFNGKQYDVIRSYQIDCEELELVVKERVGRSE